MNKKMKFAVAALLIGATGTGIASAHSTNFSVGTRGADVVELQTVLEAKDFMSFPMGVAKGYFGQLTRSGLVRFQASVGLPQTGVYDTATEAKLTGKNHGGTSMMPDTNTKAAGLRVLLNALNREHANLASETLRHVHDNDPSTAAAAGSLDKNSLALAQSIEDVYGAEAEAKFLEIWRSHITFFVNYSTASAKNDKEGMKKAEADLANYVNRISDFLSGANPNLPRAAVHQVVSTHVALLKSTVDAHADGEFEDSHAKQRATDKQIGEQVADTVAGAIVKQFPEKF